ncbi:MAG: hypothetical protein K2H02_02185, partial [Anaeroplasmataceae bacterium]|nr:hypothetical protein [Anaeroplasmataceae bacterium]
NTNGLFECLTYGSTADKYTFKYNSKDNVESITLYNSSKPKYEYIYDDFDQLIQVKDGSLKIIRSYEYDSKGEVKKIQSGNASFTYDSDETKREVEGLTVYEEFDSLSKSKILGLEGLISAIESTEVFAGSMFLKDATLRSGKYILPPLQSSDPRAPFKYNFEIKDLIPCISYTDNNPLIYSPVAIDDRFTERGCVGFWFYANDTPQDTVKYKTLLQIRGTDCKNQILIQVTSDGSVTLQIYDDSQEQKVFDVTRPKIIFNQWNFIGLNFSYRDDGDGYLKVQSYMLQLNDETKEKKVALEMNFLSGATYHIGHAMNSANQIVDSMGSYITGLIIGLRKNITTKEMKDYYSMSKDYILRPTYEDDNSIYHSSVSTHNLTAKNIDWFEIYPLHHHPNSIKGKKPIAFHIRGTDSHNLTFGYNSQSKRYAYMADEGRLEYSLDMTRTGTIIMRAFIKEEADKRYLFECKDNNKQKFGLFILSNYVYLECNGTSYNTNLKFESNKWHTVGISFDGPTIADSVTSIKVTSLRVYVDGKTYTLNVSLDCFSNLKLSLGRKFDPVTIKNLHDGYATYTYQPLCGQIEMLTTRAAYCEESTLNALSNELKDTTKVREYDGFGRFSKLVLKESDVNILSHEYIYTSKKEISTSIENLSHQISQEKISMGGKYPISRSYQIDALGNVTKITDVTFGNHSYTYNNRGFLTKEDSTEYSYDDNG